MGKKGLKVSLTILNGSSPKSCTTVGIYNLIDSERSLKDVELCLFILSYCIPFLNNWGSFGLPWLKIMTQLKIKKCLPHQRSLF